MKAKLLNSEKQLGKTDYLKKKKKVFIGSPAHHDLAVGSLPPATRWLSEQQQTLPIPSGPTGPPSICSCHVPQPLQPLSPRTSPAASHEEEWSHLPSTALHLPQLCRWTMIFTNIKDPVTSWAISGQSTQAKLLSFQQQIGKNWKTFFSVASGSHSPNT